MRMESYAARGSASGAQAVQSASTQFGCGFGWHSEVSLGYARAKSGTARAEALGLSGKTGLIPRHDDVLGLALAWGVTATSLAGASFKHEGSALALVASKVLAGQLTGHASLGWARSQSARASSTTWNLAAEYTVLRGFDIGAELYGENRGKPWWGAGMRWALTERLSLDGSYSVQRDTPRVKLLTVGANLGF